MTKTYKAVKNSAIEFELTITKDELSKAQKKVINNYRDKVSIKGFRKGSATDEMIMQHMGLKLLEEEVLNASIEKVYKKFVIDNKLSPVGSPDVKFPEKEDNKKDLTLKCSVEIAPKIDLGTAWKKIKYTPNLVKISDKEVDEVISTIMAQDKTGSEVSRAAKDGDLLDVDFAGKNDKGEDIPNTSGEKVVFRLGQGQFLPDLEKAFIKMKAGEKKDKVIVSFPEKYHSAEMAGKKIPFNIKLNKVSEINIDKISAEQIEQILGKKADLSEFRKTIKENISTRKQHQNDEKSLEKYKEEISSTIKIELPLSWVNNETTHRLNDFKNRNNYKAGNDQDFWKKIGKTEKDMKKELDEISQKSLSSYLILMEIIKAEKVELDKDELLEVDEQMKKGQQDRQALIVNRKIDKFLQGVRLASK